MYWQDMKNFTEQIRRIVRSLHNQDKFGVNYAVEKHTKISVEIRISANIPNDKYRWTNISNC